LGKMYTNIWYVDVRGSESKFRAGEKDKINRVVKDGGKQRDFLWKVTKEGRG